MLIRRDKALTAISVMLDVAFHGGRSATVSAADIADRLGLARRGMEPLLQSLSRAGLLESVRGPRGGYRLGKPRREIRLLDIAEAVTAEEPDSTDGPTGRLHAAVVERVWSEINGQACGRLSAISLDDLIRQAAAAGLSRPANEPISFAI